MFFFPFLNYETWWDIDDKKKKLGRIFTLKHIKKPVESIFDRINKPDVSTSNPEYVA